MSAKVVPVIVAEEVTTIQSKEVGKEIHLKLSVKQGVIIQRLLGRLAVPNSGKNTAMHVNQVYFELTGALREILGDKEVEALRHTVHISADSSDTYRASRVQDTIYMRGIPSFAEVRNED